MDSLANDRRFARAFTDPRFRPMPTLQKKVKIDKRFKAVLSSKDYGHRVLLDKRGRPIHGISKKGKHEMERYYQISSDDSSSSDDEEDDSSADDDQDQNETKQDSQSQQDDSEADSETSEKPPPKNKKKLQETESNKKSLKKNKSKEEVVEKLMKTDKKKSSSSKKRQLADEEDDEASAEKRPAPKRLKKKVERPAGEKKSSSSKKGIPVDEEEEATFEKEQRRMAKLSKTKRREQDMSDMDDDDDEEMEEEEDSSSESDTSSDDSSDEEVSGEEVDTSNAVPVMKKSSSVDHSWNELHAKAPTVSDSTHRLAVCNMDWDFVRAQDLFVLFKSFAGEGGAVRSVTIYPSEFGKERIAEDAVLGPREIRGNVNGDVDQSESEDSDDMEESSRKKHRRIDSEIMKRKAKQRAKAQNEAMRGYQLNRLRYYFAVVDCNSVEAADTIYKECDGMEYQLSSIRIDLRFIPDDMTFDDPPKDSFSDAQGLIDFKPNYFLSSALSQGKVNVTWDETEFDRIRNKITNAQRDELEQIVEENLYADNIAPPESDDDIGDDDERPQWLKTALGEDSDEEEQEAISEEKRINLYRQVLMDKLAEDKEKVEKETEVDKEFKWKAGLKTAYETKLKRREKIKEDSQGVVVDTYLERKREKRRRKKELAKSEGGGDEDNDMPDIIDDSLKEMMESEGRDVSTKKGKKKTKLDKKKASKENQNDSEAEREKAQLELLLMRDEEDRKIAKPEAVKEKLTRRQKKKISMQKSEKRKQRREGMVTLDVEDDRFGAMFTSHHFHIDPNHGQFRKTKNNMKLLDEQIKRMSKSKREKLSKNSIGGSEEMDEDSRSISKKLVESLKSKMKK